MLLEQMEFNFELAQPSKNAVPSGFEQMEFDFDAPFKNQIKFVDAFVDALESVG